MKNWILTHKILSIILACVLVAGITCAIVLPITLNKHDDGESSEKQTYTITFDSTGGSEVKSITAKAGEKISAPEAPVKGNYIFDGWYESTDNGTTLAEKAFEFSYMPAYSITLYAKWGVPTVVGKTYKVSDVNLSGTKEEKAAVLDEIGIATEEQFIMMYKSTALSLEFVDDTSVAVVFVMEKTYAYRFLYTMADNGTITFYENAENKQNGVPYKEEGIFEADFVVTADCSSVNVSMQFSGTVSVTVVCTIDDGKIDIPEHAHTFAEEWSSNETEHWHAATCGHATEVKDKAEHTYDDGKITAPATCTEEGEKTYTCTVCGYEKTEIIAKTEHTLSEEWSYNEGQHFHICTVCKNAVETSKANHDDSLQTYGLCKTCGFKQTTTIEYDDDESSYWYVTDFSVNDRIYIEVTISGASDDEWRIDVDAQGCTEGDDYEINVYDADGKEVSEYLTSGKTYYIVIICMNDVNQAKITVLDSNAM